MERFSYGMKISTKLSYENTLEATVSALKAEGFGVLTEVDVQSTFKKKIDSDFKRYIILVPAIPTWLMPPCRPRKI